MIHTMNEKGREKMKKRIVLSAILCVIMAFSGAFIACNKTVDATGVKLNKTAIELVVGQNETLKATVMPEKASDKRVTWESSNPTVAAVDTNGKVVAEGTGTAIITVTSISGNHTATCSVTVKPNVVRVTGVTLNEDALSMMEGETGTLSASVTPSNAADQRVEWTSSAPTIVSVDDNGNLVALEVGTATITATTMDGGFTATCLVSVTAVPTPSVPVIYVTVSPTTLSLNAGNTAQLAVTIAPLDATNKNVTWESDAESVATVDNNGLVTAVAEGTATITVTTEDGGLTATCEITVNPALDPSTPVPVGGVTLSFTSMTLNLNATTRLTATVLPADAANKNVTWKSSVEGVATVDDNGLVTAVSAGETTITVTTEDGEFTATCTVTVAEMALNYTSYNLSIGTAGTGTVKLVVSLGGEPVTDVIWESSQNNVATVDDNGLVTAVGSGNATIRAKITVGGNQITFNCNVTVTSSDVQLPEI